jgi:flagellar basal-body rod modification protein FlgD
MPTTSVPAVASSSALSQASATGLGLTSDSFLKLLVAQLKNQDPLNPIDDTQFTSQLAQFSTLEGVTQLNTNFADLLALQQLTQGANLVGRTVVYQPAGSDSLKLGLVQGIQVQNGQLAVQVNGTLVTLDQVLSVEQAQSPTTTKTTN